MEDKFISLTDSAYNKLVEYLNEYSDDYFIRVSVKGGGCSGLLHDLTYDNVITTKDIINTDRDIKIITDKMSYMYLIDTILDYSDGLNGKGFIFKNENWGRECGCGQSFSM
jgi:iron-sulfur cluster assembly protein